MQLDEEKTGKEKKFFDLVLKALRETSLKLYDLKYMQGQKILRVYLINEKTKTASLDECALVNSLIWPLIDELDSTGDSWVPENFTLEVSSPGIARDLKNREHFAWVVGEEIELNVKGTKEIGPLLDLNSEGVTIENRKGEKVFFTFSEIKKANLKSHF